MNSVHEQCPNSDLNNAQNSALHQAACPMSRPHWMSRHRFLPLAEQARSRPHWMSRPQVQQARSRRQSMSRPPGRQAYVATSTSCRDINPQQARSRRQNDVATSCTVAHVVTSKGCRDIKIISASSLLRRDAMSRPPLLPPMSRPQNDVVTSTATCCNSTRSRRLSLVATSACRDLQTRSRPSAGNWQ